MASTRAVSEESTECFMSGAYALMLLNVVRPWNVTAEQLFEPLELDERELENPEARIPISALCDVIRRARLLTGEPGLGILLGLQTRLNSYGYLSFAAMCAASLGECIELTTRFSPYITTAYSIRLNRSDGIAALVVEEVSTLGEARDVVLLGLLLGMRTLGCILTGREPWRPIDVAMPEPLYYRRFAHLVPELRFDQPINQIVLLESDLELPLLTPDRAALRLAVEQCERSMQSLGISTGIEQRIFQLILQRDAPLAFNKVASALAMSPRTLTRRLAESGVTFSALVEKARRERAILLLRSADVSLDEAADRLGYSNVSNLVRAFRRWTGMTPAAYRRRISGRLAIHLPLRRGPE